MAHAVAKGRTWGETLGELPYVGEATWGAELLHGTSTYSCTWGEYVERISTWGELRRGERGRATVREFERARLLFSLLLFIRLRGSWRPTCIEYTIFRL